MKCPSCGNENMENAAFCTKCGKKITPETAQPTQPFDQLYNPQQTANQNPQQQPAASPYAQQQPAANPYAPQQPITATAAPYAGLGARFLAHIVDGILLSVVLVICLLIIGVLIFLTSGGMNAGGQPSPAAMLLGLLFYPLYFGTVIGYMAYFESSKFQATPGKMLLKIKVVNQDGQRLSFLNSLGRNAFKLFIGGPICMIGYIMAFFNDNKQALHDTVASTFVIDASPTVFPQSPQ